MSFDIVAIQAEIAAAPPFAGLADDLAIAVVNDLFRHAGVAPVTDVTWAGWQKTLATEQRAQLAVLAHWTQTTSLRAATIEALRGRKLKVRDHLPKFFELIRPLNAELITQNPTRQQEFLRKWAHVWDVGIVGEDAKTAARRLDQLDYAKTLAEFDRADRARKEEAERKAAAIREAQERASESQWRE